MEGKMKVFIYVLIGFLLGAYLNIPMYRVFVNLMNGQTTNGMPVFISTDKLAQVCVDVLINNKLPVCMCHVDRKGL
jgi:hypothetical protein